MKVVRCQRIQYGEVPENRTFENKYIRIGRRQRFEIWNAQRGKKAGVQNHRSQEKG